ncbi:MAG: peptidoglycan editing factor PgeF [Sphingomonadales bacterium]|nr:peptidoglycan editing factor PgeF [Sphingomonadales bacterium]
MSGVGGAPPFVAAAALRAISHGFFGRRGGISQAPFASLNVGSGSDEDAEILGENRRRIVDAVAPGATLLNVYQVHGSDCVIAEDAWAHDDRPQADAMVTATPGLLLGILTADCAPVLLADRGAGVVGAAHAGWQGALAGVTDTTIAAMETLGAGRADIVAAIGPAIGRASYEVDHDFRARFAEADPANEKFFTEGAPGHAQFDLAGYVAHRLAAAGVGRIEIVDRDTYALADAYFSYRRATHRGEPGYGRQLSVIGL